MTVVRAGGAELVRCVAELAPALRAAGAPVRLGGAVADLGLTGLLDRLAPRLDVPGFVPAGADDRETALERLVTERILALPGAEPPGAAAQADPEEAVAGWVAEARRRERVPREVVSADGSPLRVFTAGDSARPPVVVVPACGMPVGLVAGWLDGLGDEFFVVTWESRGMFCADPGVDGRGAALADHGDDVLAVLAAYDLADVHLMGHCGGAPVALEAAARSARVASVSLWFGDYELGDDAPRTVHQQDMIAMLARAGSGRAAAATLHRLFERPRLLGTLRADIAHHLIHPYLTVELLHLYGRLNHAIMTTDVRSAARAVSQPTLVATSERDRTAHPAGSKHVAGLVPGARLQLVDGDDHLAAFDAAPALLDLARHAIRAGGRP